MKRRKPTEIALEVLDYIDERSEATKWDILKILGTEWQFQHWMEEFLLKERFVEKRQRNNRCYYAKTEAGAQLHELLKNGKMLKALIKMSGKRLRRY